MPRQYTALKLERLDARETPSAVSPLSAEAGPAPVTFTPTGGTLQQITGLSRENAQRMLLERLEPYLSRARTGLGPERVAALEAEIGTPTVDLALELLDARIPGIASPTE